jgi:chromate transporter
VLFACGVTEIAWRRVAGGLSIAPFPALLAAAAGGGTFASIAWVAFKVGALSYGGGFVIIPLMQADAVERYGWMTDAEFLNAVALGQVTPGPVTHTVAAVGYAAAGVPGAVLAALVAFAPSFAFVLVGARRFDRFVANRDVRSFFDGAGPAAIGAILGSAIPLTLALQETWQYVVLVGAAVALFALRRGVVSTLLVAGAVGALAVVLGAPVE